MHLPSDNRKLCKNKLSNCHNCHSPSCHCHDFSTPSKHP